MPRIQQMYDILYRRIICNTMSTTRHRRGSNMMVLIVSVILAVGCYGSIGTSTAATAVALGRGRSNLRPARHSSSIIASVPTRRLQLGTGVLERYQVGESKIDFDGMNVELVYPLSDLVPDNSVSIQTFSDAECTIDISENNYLFNEITYDDNPDPTGEKNREVTVTYTFDPKEIVDEDVWIVKEDNTVFLSFCTAIILHSAPLSDPNSAPFTRLDTAVSLQVDFEGGFTGEVPVGPADRLNENAQELYTVDGFICDESNEVLETDRPMVQGEKVRICVKPVDRALADGVYMRQVDSFTFYRAIEDGTQLTQTALTDGKSASPELTEITCQRGSTVCWFETLLKGDFYYKPGIISGYGEAWLQFGTGSLRRLQIGTRNLLEVSGGFAQAASIEVSFFGVPSGTAYLAEAYHCDQYNRRLDSPSPLYVGNSARICVAPTDEGREVGIRINRIENFNFTRGLNRQGAIIDNQGAEDGQSVVVCEPNSEVCAFRTILREDFFTSSGLVDAVGLVTLQYSENNAFQELNTYVGDPPQRKLNEESSYLIAGQSTVSVDTPVAYQIDDSLNPCAFEHKFHEWWAEEDTEDKIKYIAIVVFTIGAGAMFVLCCWLVPPFFLRRGKTIETSGNDVCVNVGVTQETDNNNKTQVEERASEDVVPGKYDIVFGEKRRPMTLKFLKHVRTVARDHLSQEYGPHVYRSCKKPFEACGFFSIDVEGKYRKLSREEAIGMIGKAFVDAKIQLGEDQTTLTSNLAGDTITTAVSKDCSEDESRRTRMIRRMSSTGTISELPSMEDVVLGDKNHLGTKRFLKNVKRIAVENPDTDYQASIYQSIKKSVEGSDFYSIGENGTYRKSRKSEICSLLGKEFEKAQSELRWSAQSMRITIDVNQVQPEDLSSIGESLDRPWAVDGVIQRSGKCRRSRSRSDSSSSSRSGRSKASRKISKSPASTSRLLDRDFNTDNRSFKPSRDRPINRRAKSMSDLGRTTGGASRTSKGTGGPKHPQCDDTFKSVCMDQPIDLSSLDKISYRSLVVDNPSTKIDKSRRSRSRSRSSTASNSDRSKTSGKSMKHPTFSSGLVDKDDNRGFSSSRERPLHRRSKSFSR